MEVFSPLKCSVQTQKSAAKQIKHTLTTDRHNTLHKRYQYNINQLKKTFQNNNLTIVRADKSKAIVVLNKNNLEKKADNFIQGNHITQLNKGPTDTYQKQIQQIIQKCNTLVDKQARKYLVNVKPTA